MLDLLKIQAYSFFPAERSLCCPSPTTFLCCQIEYAFQKFQNIHIETIFTSPFLKMGLVPALSQQSKSAMGGGDRAVGAAWALHVGPRGNLGFDLGVWIWQWVTGSPPLLLLSWPLASLRVGVSCWRTMNCSNWDRRLRKSWSPWLVSESSRRKNTPFGGERLYISPCFLL